MPCCCCGKEVKDQVRAWTIVINKKLVACLACNESGAFQKAVERAWDDEQYREGEGKHDYPGRGQK